MVVRILLWQLRPDLNTIRLVSSTTVHPRVAVTSSQQAPPARQSGFTRTSVQEHAPAGAFYDGAGGIRAKGLKAPFAYDGAMNGTVFLAYVVTNNLPGHKAAGIRDAIEAAGTRPLCLPSYSPDFNPIGSAFSKLKGAAARKGRKDDCRPVDTVGGSRPLHP
jgi:hypothetical protein